MFRLAAEMLFTLSEQTFKNKYIVYGDLKSIKLKDII